MEKPEIQAKFSHSDLNWEASVRKFHQKYGFPVDAGLPNEVVLMKNLSEDIAALASHLDPEAGLASCRCHLILEELGEFVEGLNHQDEVATLDALADLIYVVVGTAVAFGLPLCEAFKEVHRSNMTKTISRDRPGHPGKSDGYSPPNLKKILDDAKKEV